MAAKTSIQKDKQSQAGKKASDTRRRAKAEAEEPKESQQEPEQDSGLQTPQPDQPMPTEVERREQESRKDDSDSEPRPEESETADDAPEQPQVDEGDQPDAQPDQPESFVKHVIEGGRSFRADTFVPPSKQVEAFDHQEAERAAAREKHNQRTAGNLDALKDDEPAFAATGRKAG